MSRRKWAGAVLAVGIAVVGLLGLLVGCNEDHQSYCEAKIDCEHGTQEDMESCLHSVQSERDLAGKCGCSSLCDDWFDCILEEGTCQLPTTWVRTVEDGESKWETETDYDAPGTYVWDEQCFDIRRDLSGCEVDAGLDPEHGGWCES
jgi:hypothetical protein